MTINIKLKKKNEIQDNQYSLKNKQEALANAFSDIDQIQPALNRGVKRSLSLDTSNFHQRNVKPRIIHLPSKITGASLSYQKKKRKRYSSTHIRRYRHRHRLPHRRRGRTSTWEVMEYLRRAKASRHIHNESDIISPSPLEQQVQQWAGDVPSSSSSSSSITPPSLHIELYSNHFTLQSAGTSLTRSLPYNDATRDFLKAVDEGRLIPDVLAELPDRTHTYFDNGSIVIDIVDRRKIEQAERKRRHETTGDHSGFRFSPDNDTDGDDERSAVPSHKRVRLTPDTYTLHSDISQFIDDSLAVKGITPTPMDRVRVLQRILEVSQPHLCIDPTPDVFRAANGILSARQRAILRPRRRPRHSGLPAALLSGPTTPRTEHSLLNFLVRKGWSSSSPVTPAPRYDQGVSNHSINKNNNMDSNSIKNSNVLSPAQQALLWEKKFKIHLSAAIDRQKQLCVETEDRHIQEMLVVRPGPNRGQYEAYIQTRTANTPESSRKIILGSCSSAERFFTMYKWLRSRAGFKIRYDRTKVVDLQKQQQQQQQQYQQQQQPNPQPNPQQPGPHQQNVPQSTPIRTPNQTIPQSGMPSRFNPNQQQNK